MTGDKGRFRFLRISDLLLTRARNDGWIDTRAATDGARILSASWDQTIREWSAADGVLLRTFAGHTDSVNSAVYSGDGARILSDCAIGEWKIWNASNGQCLAAYKKNDPALKKAKTEFQSSGNKNAETGLNTMTITPPPAK